MSTNKNYITAKGYQTLKDELYQLVHHERPNMVEVVSWAAGNGDRSENGDYLYGKKRLREIDRRIRFLTHRLEIAEIVDPEKRETCEQVFFGATVEIERENGIIQKVSIVGVDEIDTKKGKISWLSPLAQCLFKNTAGDTAILKTPEQEEMIEILSVKYTKID